MCGIGGIINLSKNSSKLSFKDISIIRSLLKKRGPDFEKFQRKGILLDPGQAITKDVLEKHLKMFWPDLLTDIESFNPERLGTQFLDFPRWSGRSKGGGFPRKYRQLLNLGKLCAIQHLSQSNFLNRLFSCPTVRYEI